MTLNHFSGYVLAGGKSSRMNSDKALLKIGDETFLERAVSALKSSCSPIKIVINESQKAKFETSFPQLDFILDIQAERGAIGGIHAALKDCQSAWAIILAVDLPFVTSETILKLAQICVDSKEISAVVARQADDRLQPLCAIYHAANCLSIIEKLLSDKASVSVRDFLQLVAARFVGFDTFENNDLLFFNVNHPSDYEQIDYLKTSK